MKYPLESIPANRRTFWLRVLLAGTALIMLVMGVVGGPLTVPDQVEMGIVSFEIAPTVERAQQILNAWDAPTQVRASFIQGLDFLFLLVYSTTVGLGCLMAGDLLQQRGWPLAGLGSGLAWGQWAAALFDAIENTALVVMLFGGAANVEQPWPMIATVCASLKFALLFCGMAYAFYGLAVRLLPKGKS